MAGASGSYVVRGAGLVEIPRAEGRAGRRSSGHGLRMRNALRNARCSKLVMLMMEGEEMLATEKVSGGTRGFPKEEWSEGRVKGTN